MKNPSHESLVRAGWISDSENPAAMVEVTLVHAGHVSTTRATPLQHDFAAHAVRQRQAKGLFTVCEVAQEFENFSFIADAESFLHNRLIPAITNGKLRVMSESDGFPLADCTKVNVMGDYLTPADVNAWLVKQGTPFRWKEGAPVVEINGLTGAPFCEALQQPEYQKTPEYQAEYNRAVQADIDKTEKQLNEWENLRAETVPEKERKEQKIAALTARINALMASFFPTEPQAAPVVQVPAKRRTLWDVVTPYIIEVMQAGQYASAKELFKALETKAGQGSPFDKGSDNNRYSLFVRDICEPLAWKTLQNRWPKLREAAKK